MTEENNEVLMLMKELVDRVKALEQQVYDKDNLLMKSGMVVVDSPRPNMGVSATPTTDSVSNMSWDDIHKMVENIG